MYFMSKGFMVWIGTPDINCTHECVFQTRAGQLRPVSVCTVLMDVQQLSVLTAPPYSDKYTRQ